MRFAIPVFLAIVALPGCGTDAELPTAATSTNAAFTLTSPIVANGGSLPSEYTCDGVGASLALAWANAPSNTKEFALLMTTLPGDGTTKWNWVLYHIPVAATALARNTQDVGVAGVGSDGPTAAYQPPCSQGPGAKVYTFTLYALSAVPSFSGTVTGPVVTAAIANITIASASLNVSYARIR